MRALLISSSNVHGFGYLDHAETELRQLLEGVDTLHFVPFALADHAMYTAKVRERFAPLGIAVEQVHDRADAERAQAIFIGGGNTFRLLNELYRRDLVGAIRDRFRSGMPYVGSSAGTNVATPSIMTTNDMPIVYPPSFDALGLVSFQINPHYLDPDPNSTHRGETREQRITEFLEENDRLVVGLREASMLRVSDAGATLVGPLTARIFQRGSAPREVEPGSMIG